MEINLVAFCYRGSYFYEKYGPAVRDLQMLITLAQMEGVSVTLLERPISMYERVLGKFFQKEFWTTTIYEYTIKRRSIFLGP